MGVSKYLLKYSYFIEDDLELTSLPYFWVKLSHICLKVTYSSPKVSHNYPKVTYSYPKVTYSDPKVTHSDPTHLPIPLPASPGHH